MAQNHKQDFFNIKLLRLDFRSEEI